MNIPLCRRTAASSTAHFFIGVLSAIVLALLTPHTAFASAGAAGGLPYEPWLEKFLTSMTGPVAFGLSMVGIVAAGGVLIFGGELNAFIRTVFFLILVMALLVGAQNMMSTFFGRGAEVAALGDYSAAPPHLAAAVARTRST